MKLLVAARFIYANVKIDIGSETERVACLGRALLGSCRVMVHVTLRVNRVANVLLLFA